MEAEQKGEGEGDECEAAAVAPGVAQARARAPSREAAGARAGAAAAVASRFRLAWGRSWFQGGGTVLDEVRMPAARGRLVDEHLERRREEGPPRTRACAGLICR